MPFSKMVGLEVTPLRPSPSTSSRSVPSSSSWRFRLSIQMACPSASISRSLLLMARLLAVSGGRSRSGELVRGRGDRFGVYAGLVDQLLRRPGAGHRVHCQLTHAARLAGLGEGGQDRVAEAAFGPVVLDRDDRAGLGGRAR